MHILILNWRDPKNPKSGGAEIVTMEHAKRWVKMGHRVSWFTSSFSKGAEKERINGVEIIRKGSSFTVHLRAFFYYFLSGEKFDVVIDEIHGLPFFTPIYVRKPKIAFIHEIAGVIWDYWLPVPFNSIGKTIEKIYFILYKNVTFWTDAKSTIEELETYGINKKNCYAISCPSTIKAVKEIPSKETNPTMIYVSRLIKSKGIEDVLEAFSLIAQKVKKARLWIVGEGDVKYTNFLKEKVERLGLLGAVKFFGFLNDKRKKELLLKAHLLLHASVKEGWGLVVIEAASQATPAIVYNVGGLRDVVINGQTGSVLTNNAPAALAEEIAFLFSHRDRYLKYQKNCLLRTHNLTWDKVSKQSMKLINRSKLL